MAWTREAEILFCRTKTFHGDAKNSAWQSDRKMAKSVENLWGSARKSLMIGEKKFEFAIYFAQTNFVAVVQLIFLYLYIFIFFFYLSLI
jgi:hypothetical protein